jgi:SAM-dependent methyltransferase
VTDPARRHRDERRRHWDAVARESPAATWAARPYHERLAEVYRFRIPEGQRVLEVGCGTGDLLAALRPSVGVGVDFSVPMVAAARARHPSLHFVVADAHELPSLGPFDVIILSDLVNDCWDVQAVLAQLAPLCAPHTRLVCNSQSRLWEPLLALALRVGLARPVLRQNWLAPGDLRTLLALEGFEVVRRDREILLPVRVPFLARFANRVLARLPLLRHLTLTNVLVARRLPPPAPPRGVRAPSVSIVIPARNEAGNIPAVFDRLPRFADDLELIFVEGHSRDDTWAAITREVANHPAWRCQALRQTGQGKGDAVRLGFARARGDVLMILDADLTMPPEELPRFHAALVEGRGDFINGVRLVYPMEGEAMRFLNLLGNHFFSLAFSALLGQRVKDTLCGTKVLWRRDYARIAAHRADFGDFDPFGDFDLLFGAAKLGLRITDLPIRYRDRTYGTTNIQRWRHGLLLLRMTWFALWRLTFR